jgi:DNA-binding MarR family transcriptional regulator
MNSKSAAAGRGRRRQLVEIKESLRELGNQLSLLNYRVGGRLELKGTDLDCLDLIGRAGPLSPGAIARRSGLHPATLTGILDRLERGGWVVRERDPADRRGVLVRVRKERAAEIFGLYAGMNSKMDQILAGYDEDQLDVIADFLHRTAEAGRSATDDLA